MGRLLTLLRKKGADFSPLDLPGLALWLDASDTSTITDTGGAVSSWTSKDPNARVFSQAPGALQPTTGAATQNGKNVLSFAGDYLTTTAAKSVWNFLHGSETHTIVAIAKYGTVADPNAAYGLMGTNAAAAVVGAFHLWDDRVASSRNNAWLGNVRSSGIVVSALVNDWVPANEYCLVTVHMDAGNATAASRHAVALNAGAGETSNTFTNAPGAGDSGYDLQIGALGNGIFPFTGEIAEVLVYTPALSEAELTLLRSARATYWGVAGYFAVQAQAEALHATRNAYDSTGRHFVIAGSNELYVSA